MEIENLPDSQVVDVVSPEAPVASPVTPELQSTIERIISEQIGNVVSQQIKTVFAPIQTKITKATAPLDQKLASLEQQIQALVTQKLEPQDQRQQQQPQDQQEQQSEASDDLTRQLQSLKSKVAEQTKTLALLEQAKQEEAKRARESRHEASLFKARSEFNRTTDLLVNTGLKLADGVTPDDVLASLEKRNAIRLAKDTNGDPQHYEILNEDEFGVTDYVRLDPNTLSKALKPISFLVNSGRAGSGAGVPTNTAPTPSQSPYNSQAVLDTVNRMSEAELDRKLSTDEAFRSAYYKVLEIG
jgi:vacuolar-type H+-ATPase subunit I/STV1